MKQLLLFKKDFTSKFLPCSKISQLETLNFMKFLLYSEYNFFKSKQPGEPQEQRTGEVGQKSSSCTKFQILKPPSSLSHLAKGPAFQV